MTRLSRTLLPALLALAALAPFGRTAAAQEIRSPLRYIEETQGLSVFGGYLFSSPTFALDDSTRAELGPRSAPLFGARYQVRVTGPITAMAQFSFSPSERKLLLAEAANVDSTAIRVIDTGTTVSSPIGMAEAGLTLHLTGPRAYRGFAPYVGVNAGVAAELGGTSDEEREVPEQERFDFGPSFAVGTRLGTDIFVTRAAAVRFELNGRLWRQSVPAGFRNTNQSGLSEWNNASSVQVGAVLHF